MNHFQVSVHAIIVIITDSSSNLMRRMKLCKEMKDTRKQHSQFTTRLSGTANNAWDNKAVPCNKLTMLLECIWSLWSTIIVAYKLTVHMNH